MTDEEYKAFIDKYTPSELDELKNKIRMARFTYVITDPFPELSDWQNRQNMRNELEKFMNDKIGLDPKPKISAHEAYRKGMEFMWSLIEPLVK